MNDTATARPTRAEQTRRERRMKPGATVNAGIKLSLDEDRLDRKTYDYRWVNDVPGRVKQLEAMDWDVVKDDEAKTDGTGAGTVPTVHGGIGDNGKPHGMVLMRKFKDWADEDRKRKRKPLDEMDEAIRRGTAHKAAGEADLAAEGVTYTPTTNTIDAPKGVAIR